MWQVFSLQELIFNIFEAGTKKDNISNISQTIFFQWEYLQFDSNFNKVFLKGQNVSKIQSERGSKFYQIWSNTNHVWGVHKSIQSSFGSDE